MIHKIAGLPGTLTLSVTSNSILSLNSHWLPITSNNIALRNTCRHYDINHLATGDAVKR